VIAGPFYFFPPCNHIININKNNFLFPAKQKTAQFFRFIFGFIRELNLYCPPCFVTHSARELKTYTAPLVSISQIINQPKPILPPCAMNPPWIRTHPLHESAPTLQPFCLSGHDSWTYGRLNFGSWERVPKRGPFNPSVCPVMTVGTYGCLTQKKKKPLTINALKPKASIKPKAV